MRIIKRTWKALSNERGSEVFEYTILAGLLAILCIAVLAEVVPRLVARWTALDNALSPGLNTAPATPPRPIPPLPAEGAKPVEK